ncbi:MAG: hypothetical protein NW224_01915 [Leptolyngbyaceae cyanobacterium bins.302]|nr:hypothetical protein [Leptolyngbyaceae cyanobacterium bins.302]
MSGLINLIKNIFSGIFGFIGGIFGSKKSVTDGTPKPKKGNGYFLELDDAKISPAASAASTGAASPAPASAPAQPMTVSQETAAEVAPAGAAKSAKTSSRKEKLAALAAGGKPDAIAAEPTADAPVTSAPPTPTPEVTKTPVSEAAFATKYLIPSNNGSRRRPGANMSSYLDMARKMNVAS